MELSHPTSNALEISGKLVLTSQTGTDVGTIEDMAVRDDVFGEIARKIEHLQEDVAEIKSMLAQMQGGTAYPEDA